MTNKYYGPPYTIQSRRRPWVLNSCTAVLTVFTRHRHLSLSSSILIHTFNSLPVSLRSFLYYPLFYAQVFKLLSFFQFSSPTSYYPLFYAQVFKLLSFFQFSSLTSYYPFFYAQVFKLLSFFQFSSPTSYPWWQNPYSFKVWRHFVWRLS